MTTTAKIRPALEWEMVVNDAKIPRPVYRGSLLGIDVYTDETMPADRMDFRDHTGRLVGRITGLPPE